jgi:hypothetical protein
MRADDSETGGLALSISCLELAAGAEPSLYRAQSATSLAMRVGDWETGMGGAPAVG